MADWKDTYPELFSEADAAKEKAKRDFIAALRPPNPEVVPPDKRIELIDAITSAQWQALLRHIGPFSSDGSIASDIHITEDGVKELDLRVAYNTYEFHVGNHAPYATIQAAVDAINALPSGRPRCTVVLHAGSYDYTGSASITVPADTTITAPDRYAIGVKNNDHDLFICGGQNIVFKDFVILGADSASYAGIRGNNQNAISVVGVNFLTSSTQNGLFIAQSGATWLTFLLEDCLVNSTRTVDWTCRFVNTSGAARYVGLDVNGVFADAYFLTNNGGSFYIEACQDVRFRICKIRGLDAYEQGIYLTNGSSTGRAWMDLFACSFYRHDDGAGNKAFVASTNTDVTLAYCDYKSYTQGAGATVTVVGGGSGTGGYNTAYSVDFTTLSAQNLLTGGNGNKTVDGKTCVLSNAANATSVYLNSGQSGLYFRCNTNNSFESNTLRTGPRLEWPLANLASALDVNSLWTEIFIWLMFSQPHTPNANFEFGFGGVVMTPYTFASNFQSVRAQRGYSTTLLQQVEALNNNTESFSTALTSTPDVWAFRIVNFTHVEVLSGTSSGGNFPARSSLTKQAMYRVSSPSLNNAASWSLFLGAFTGNTAGAADILFTKLLVESR